MANGVQAHVAVLNRMKRMHGWVRAMTFNNHLSLMSNALHGLHDGAVKALGAAGLARELAPGIPDDARDAGTQIADALRNVGFALVPGLLDAETTQSMAATVDETFRRGDGVLRDCERAGLLRLADTMDVLPGIEALTHTPRFVAALHRYYGGYFRLFGADVYRTAPSPTGESFGSQSWHFDSVPRGLVKVLIYLTNVERDTGAMRIVPKSESRRLMRAGFIYRTQGAEYSERILPREIPLEGVAGTGIFFTPQFCVHRAAEPRSGSHRDVINLMLYPSLRTQGPLSAKDRKVISTNFTYPATPLSKRAAKGHFKTTQAKGKERN